MFRILQCQCLMHADPTIGIITFIFLKDLPHGIRQGLIFPWTVFIGKILINPLSADMKRSAEKHDIPFCFAVFRF